jgi:hypothetical protein
VRIRKGQIDACTPALSFHPPVPRLGHRSTGHESAKEDDEIDQHTDNDQDHDGDVERPAEPDP